MTCKPLFYALFLLTLTSHLSLSTTKHLQGLSSSANVLVLLNDINDNAPNFAPKSYTSTLAEDTAIGSTATTVKATDKDSNANGRILYEILSGDTLGQFVINNRTGVLATAKPLDYEAIKKYNLTIIARDGGTPQLTGTAFVVITVTDVNDNYPVFAQANYSFTVQSLLDPLTSLAPSGQFSANAAFNVVISGAIDRDPPSGRSQYVLTARAKDGGAPSKFTDVTVIINVTDVNDNSPVFSKVGSLCFVDRQIYR